MTAITNLPARVFDPATVTEPATDPKVGDLVATYTRGRVREARVVKVGPKRLTVEYTTPGAIETAWKIAAINREARRRGEIAYQEKLAARYDAEADVIERLDLATADRDGRDAWVDWRTLPAEYRAVADAPNNYSKQTIIYPAAQMREWAQDARRAAETARGKLDADRAQDARPIEERAAECVHMTTFNAKRENVYLIP